MNLARIFNSSKFQAAFSGAALALLPLILDLCYRAPREMVQADATTFVKATVALVGVAVVAGGLEDGLHKLSLAPPAAPTTQVNVGDATNTQVAPPTQPPNDAPPAATAPPTRPKPPAGPPVAVTSTWSTTTSLPPAVTTVFGPDADFHWSKPK